MNPTPPIDEIDPYAGLQVYFGDLHSHNKVGYGHGTPEQAFENATAQLDFCCLTAHAYWPDMPVGEARLESLVDYHRRGFEQTAQHWQELMALVERFNQPGKFVTFPGFEWHSNQYGDHNVYYRQPPGEILYAPDLEALRAQFRQLKKQGLEAMVVPHHIGYKAGFRGIDWRYFTSEFSPVAEILSMHGLAESDKAPIPYLLPMGPRDGRSTMHTGLKLGKVFGVIGSTDHHSAYPGSYGHGRAALWADELTREGLWRAIHQRRTCALTGERIELRFSVNGLALGAVSPQRLADLPPAPVRKVRLEVQAASRIDYAEVLYRNRVIQRFSPADPPEVDWSNPVWTSLEVGWGHSEPLIEWQVALEVLDGILVQVEPHFRGREIVAHQGEREPLIPSGRYEWIDERRVTFSAQTWGNPTGSTASTQGLGLCLLGGPQTRIKAVFNGTEMDVTLGELAEGNRAGYLSGFVSPAYCFHKLDTISEYSLCEAFEHEISDQGGWYTARVIQKNGQGAWSSPVWV